MSVMDHITALELNHAELETELNAENSRPLPNMWALVDLKRQKLAIKDAIAKLHNN